MSRVKGYKVFNSDWTCRGFRYEVGKTYKEDKKPEARSSGFHFCKQAVDCFNHYAFDPNNKVAEVIALGEVSERDNKCSTNKIKIVREIPWEELLSLVNTGKDCTGRSNTGDSNSGDWNTGDHNSGNSNSGDWNSGYFNSGNNNSGDWNTDHWNSGDWNTGNWNSGSRNSGHFNSGEWNSGDWNTGDWNSGSRNSGNHNSGRWNSGDWNSGDWNKASNVAGCFNTEQHKLMFFDKPTDMTFEEWRNSDACMLLNRIDFRPTEWIWSHRMTDEEKAEHPGYETTGGYLRVRDNTDCCVEWWNSLSEFQKNIIKSIPNFDADKFYLITGIRV